MTDLFRVRVLMLGALIVLSCSSDMDDASIQKEVEARFESFVNKMNALEAEELKDFYSSSPAFYWVEDGRVQYADKPTLTNALTGLLSSLKSADMQVLNIRVTVLSNQSAMLFAEYEQAMEMEPGISFSINGAMTVLLEKESGTWRFVTGHSSSKKQRGG